MTIPELPGQNSWGDSVPFQPATDSQTAKGNMRRRHRQQSAFKRRPSTRRRVDLHSIRLQLLKQLAQPLESDLILLGADELLRTGGKTATASVTDTGLHTSIRGDGISRTDPFTRPRAVGGTQVRIKNSLAEMNIGSITDTHHQPGIGTGALSGPEQTVTGRADHSRIGSDVNTVHTCCCKDCT